MYVCVCVIEREDCDVSMVCALHGSPTICRVNIREGVTSSGQELMPYLQPVPLQGSGVHRYILSVFTHTDPISPASTSGLTW